MNAYEREQEEIERAYADGEISAAEMQRQMAELRRDYRAAAENAALDAYEAELERW